jgi:hypothetical protein
MCLYCHRNVLAAGQSARFHTLRICGAGRAVGASISGGEGEPLRHQSSKLGLFVRQRWH